MAVTEQMLDDIGTAKSLSEALDAILSGDLSQIESWAKAESKSFVLSQIEGLDYAQLGFSSVARANLEAQQISSMYGIPYDAAGAVISQAYGYAIRETEDFQNSILEYRSNGLLTPEEASQIYASANHRLATQLNLIDRDMRSWAELDPERFTEVGNFLLEDDTARLSSYFEEINLTVTGQDSCFPAGTLITLTDGSCKPIEAIARGDVVMSFDGTGTLVPGRVTQLLANVTDTWLELSNGTVVTPGHRFLRPDGSFAEIGEIVAEDGRIVAEDGSVQVLSAKVIRYSAETAHLFEEGEMLVAASAGSAALAPEVRQGWKTYNFTVAGHHTYIADGIRVHNDSVLSALQAGDVLVSLDTDLDNAVVVRGANGSGTAEVVLIDGVHQGDHLVSYREYVYTAPAGMSDPLAAVTAHIEANNGRTYTGSDGATHVVNLSINSFDPGHGNTYGDGVVSDDMDEALVDDLGFTRSAPSDTRVAFGSGISAGDVTVSLSGGTAVFTIALAGGGHVTESLSGVTAGMSVEFADGSSATIGTLPDTPQSDGIVQGSAGADLIDSDFLDADLEGPTGGADEIRGGWGSDTIFGYGGHDSIDGGSGHDEIHGGTGYDTIDAGNGNDTVWGDEGRDVIFLGNGDDLFEDSDQNNTHAHDSVDGGAGSDTLRGDGGNDTLSGGDDGDSISGGVGDDVLHGDGGDDTLWGQFGQDSLFGGAGNDVLINGAGAEAFTGGPGRDLVDYGVSSVGLRVDLLTPANNTASASGDTYSSIEDLRGSGYGDTLTGTHGNNTIWGDDGEDRIHGMQGHDVLHGGDGNDTIWGHQGDDTLDGDAGHDILYGSDGDDSLSGSSGNDKLSGEEGADTLDGGSGTDEASYFLATSGAALDLQNNSANSGAAAGDVLVSIERVYGSEQNDTLRGDDAANVFWGDAGDDYLNGRAGNDQIYAGTGNDRLFGQDGNDKLIGADGADRLHGGSGRDTLGGGNGNDTFLFREGDENDLIVDFEDNADTIRLLDFGISNFTQARNHAVQDGDDVVFDLGGGDVLTVRDITINALSDDMVFT